MKTTKTIITALLLFFTVTSFAQTKEETIAWLKDKLGKSLINSSHKKDVSLVSIDECRIVLHSALYDGTQITEVLPTSVSSISEDGYFKYNGKVAYWQWKNKQNYGYKDSSFIISLVETEQNLHVRVLKALKHLATFCEEGKNEAF